MTETANKKLKLIHHITNLEDDNILDVLLQITEEDSHGLIDAVSKTIKNYDSRCWCCYAEGRNKGCLRCVYDV